MSIELKEEVYLTSDEIISYLVDKDNYIDELINSQEAYVTTTQYAIYEALYSINKNELNIENLRRLIEKVEIVQLIFFEDFIPTKITGKRIIALRKRAGVYY